ncbi:MAG: recC [Herminiimonas sp.]|nr:recC [Herminiimonas sp.]
MLKILVSNRTETLLQALLTAVASDPAADPFAALHVVVPSVAMRRRIQNDMASVFGICANVRFAFLAQWLWEQVATVVPVSEESPFAPELLTWRIYGLLSNDDFVRQHPRLAAYAAKADPVMLFELSGRIASLFDKYTTYRPEWPESWMRMELVPLSQTSDQLIADQKWQMALWCRIAEDLGLRRSHPFSEFLSALSASPEGGVNGRVIPPQVHVFALPSIPPLYLRMLERLAKHTDVNLYLLNPCQEYWLEVSDPRRISYLASKGEAGYHESGNRLLAAWGKQTQGFLGLVLNVAQASVEMPLFVAQEGDSLLQRVQNAVLEMQDLEPGSAADVASDRSIEFHVCHTLARELEVLHDQLLALFNSANPPQASDVLVVVPRLEEAAPLIDAVFGSADGARRIAYSITGRPRTMASPVARALLALLSIVTSRYRASDIFALLQNPLIGARFGVSATDLDVVQSWLPLAGIHWGLDDEHRRSFGASAGGRGTLDDGMNRLFLGYALPGSVEAPFLDMLAPCNAEGDESRVLGRFSYFVKKLKSLEERLAVPASPAHWQERLLGLLEDFMDCGYDLIHDLTDVRASIVAMTDAMQAADLSLSLPVQVIRTALQAAFDQPTSGGSPTGAVTFSAISSLRNLPYKVICVVGMSDGAFPSADTPAEFDLMTASRRPGDRQKRDEERNLFLDILLAAREKLFISYTGRNVRDNAVLPPSVVVSDLLDYLAEAAASSPVDAQSIKKARAALLVEHPLQPFSEQYFIGHGDPRLVSYHDEYCNALKARQAQRAPAVAAAPLVLAGEDGNSGDSRNSGGNGDSPDEAMNDVSNVPFFIGPLPPISEEWRQVSLDQLSEFFRNPCRYLLRRRMRLSMPDEVIEIEDHEPFYPNPLSKLDLARRVLPHILEGASPDAMRALASAGLEFPTGPIGDILLDEELKSLHAFAERVRERQAGAVLPPFSHTLELDVEGEAWHLNGAVSDLRSDGLVRYRYANATASDYLSAWLAHLFLNASKGATQTGWVARNGEIQLHPLEHARELLTELIGLYRQGLSRPLHFYPKSAWAYAKKSPSLWAANAKWAGSPQFGGERDDAAYSLALRGVENPLDDEFFEITEIVFGKMKDSLATDPL